MKKKFTLFLIIGCMLLSSLPVSAQELKQTTSTFIEYNEDGSYYTTEITVSTAPYFGNSIFSTIQTKTGTKTASYTDSSGKIQWTVKVTGTFRYNGSTASCTEAKTSVSYLSSGWDVKSQTASKSRNSAVGNFTMKYKDGSTKSKTLSLSCTATGTLK